MTIQLNDMRCPAMIKLNTLFTFSQRNWTLYRKEQCNQQMEKEAAERKRILPTELRMEHFSNKHIIKMPFMETRTLKLSDSFINILVNLPENGMGYQIVKVILKSGRILHRHKVINSSLLMLEENENITEKDIEKIELESRK